MCVALLCRNETRPHLNAFGTQHKCRGETASVTDSARCDDRNIDGIDHLRHEGHRRDFSQMSAALHALGDDSVCSHLCDTLCDRHRSGYRNHLDIFFLQSRDIFARISRAGGHHADIFIENHLHDIVHVLRHQHDIQAERLIRLLLAGSYLCENRIGIPRSASDNAQSARIADGRCDGCVCNPGHSSLKNRVFDAQHFRNFRAELRYSVFHVFYPPVCSVFLIV